MNRFDLIIIGGGPAGYAAALYSTRGGLSTALIERMGPGGQLSLTDTIDNYPGFEQGIDGFTLGMKMQATAERFGALTVYDEVLSVDLSKEVKRISTSSGEYSAKCVIIATGANPRELGLPREKDLLSRGVHYCAHCDGRFYADKTVAVVGGGNSAVSDALYLSKLCKKVYLIHRRDELRATKLYHEPLLSCKNIEFLKSTAVDELIGDGRLEGIRIKDLKSEKVEELPVSALFVSIGRKPASELFRESLELDAAGYVIADESTRTSIPGVFVAGDVRTKELRQVVTAVSDGAVAAHNAIEYLNTL